MEIKRTFFHKNTGTDFGTVEIDFPTKGFKLNGTELAESSVRAIINQGLQILQDTYAGVGASKTVDEATAAYENKLAALLNGTVGERKSGEGVDPLTRFIRQIVRKALTGKNAEAYKAIPSDEQAERAKFLDGKFEGLGDDAKAKVTAMAQEALDADRAAKAKAKQAADGIDL